MKLSKNWTTVTPLSKMIALAMLVVLPFLGFYLGIQYQKLQEQIGQTPPSGGVACTMEVKLCPDGTYVSRTGPNCEFSPCPRS